MKGPAVVMADDDPDDRLLVREAWEEAHAPGDLVFVRDGEDLLDYLHRRGRYADPAVSPWPALLLVDLNMPKKDGREVVAEIKAHERFRRIPVVVITSSRDPADVARAYELGACSYIAKPPSFERLVDAVRVLSEYWLNVVELPAGPEDPAVSGET